MDRTSSTTGCLLHHRPDAELADAHEVNPPIYAALVAEWWVRGRIVPGRHDAQWATLAAPSTTGRLTAWSPESAPRAGSA